MSSTPYYFIPLSVIIWVYSLETTTYILYILPTKALKNKTPGQALFNVPQHYLNFFVVFVSLISWVLGMCMDIIVSNRILDLPST